jgi:hypothetical protein
MPKPALVLGGRCHKRNHLMTTETLRKKKKNGRNYCGLCHALTENLRWHKKKRAAIAYVAEWQ